MTAKVATGEAGPLTDPPIDLEALNAISELYHRYLTGLVLSLIVEMGEDRAVDALFGLFRRQHLDKFLPGLAKLGLDGLPDAVACAQYHYLSNHVGGVGVAYIPESDTKAWVRYTPPRWIFDGTALAAIPSRVARSMLHGWHGHNGVSLGNQNLGFVCTGQTMDGAPGLEGYYVQEDRELAPDERVRFRFGETCPPVDPSALPALAADSWPPERLAKASRNYAMDYVRNLTVVLNEQLGPLAASGLMYRTGRRIGMQYAAEITGPLGTVAPAEMLARLLSGHGDDVAIDKHRQVVQRTWRLMRGLETESVPEWFDGWRGLWEGIMAVVQPDHRLQVTQRLDCGDPAFTWSIEAKRPPGRF